MDENEQIAQQETAPAEEQPSLDTAQGDQGGLDQNAEGAIPQAAQEDHFLQGSTLDPRQLPPEVQPIFKKMQAAYTKKFQQAAEWQRQADIVDRFNNDRDFGFQTVAQWAARNGYQIAPVGQQQAQPIQRQQPGQVPPQLVEALKANLPPELQWMAEAQAPAIQTAVQQLLAPLAQQLMQTQNTRQQEQAGQEWDTLAEELSGIAPGWEEHEPEMVELYDFLTSPRMKDKKFGSKHQLLYNLVTGNAAATAQVAKRMNAAAKNRPSSGITTGRTSSNIQDRIRSAKTSQDAFKLAAQAAGFTGGE